MSRQVTGTLMMIRPVAFHLNEQTAINNYYQKSIEGLSRKEIQEKALLEFDQFVNKLRTKGIEVNVFDDTPEPETPDSIFPNNWISFHESGEIILYPMFAENRRLERREDIIRNLGETHKISKLSSLADWEEQTKFLEGTGSLILDRQHQIAYAAISERTNPEVIRDFAESTGYKAVTFHANQTVNDERLPIYHTNVMMCLGESFALICMDSIDNQEEKKQLLDTFAKTGKELILISEDQKGRFAGNMLQLENKSGVRFIVMSESAYHSLDSNQKDKLEKHGELLYSSLDIIESLGGGSARCMMAEVFLPKK